MKLTLSLSLGILGVHLTAAGYRVYRENAVFRADIGRDSRSLGRALAYAAEQAWEGGGDRGVDALVAHATNRDENMTVRWLRDGAADAELPEGAAESLRAQSPVTVTRIEPEEALVTFVPVEVAPGTWGVLEISDAWLDERDYIRDTVLTAGATVALLVSLCTLIAWVLSAQLISTPIRHLISRAREVGEGELNNRVELRGADELRALAGEMNRMCDQLQEASERASAEAFAREAALEQLRHADRLATLGSLASSVAHELGTPLNVVEGHAQLIREGSSDTSIEAHARVIVEQCRRMATIIRASLDYSRRGRQPTDHCDVMAVVEDSLRMLAPMARSTGVRIDLRCERRKHVVRMADHALQQVVLNLAVNGVQAMPDGGELTVTVSSVESRSVLPLGTQDLVVIRIDDTGEGIPEAALQRIFEPFYTTKDLGKGTGLGLPIANGIVQEHGGWIEVDSRPGRGTSFIVRIPELVTP